MLGRPGFEAWRLDGVAGLQSRLKTQDPWRGSECPYKMAKTKRLRMLHVQTIVAQGTPLSKSDGW